MSLLPPDDDLDLIHTRRYETRVYQVSGGELLVRGAVSDMKPPGLYLLDDPEPMEIHRMQLELRVTLPKLEIISAQVVFETHPNSKCPIIANDYEKLVGLSITPGFRREIRNLFGGRMAARIRTRCSRRWPPQSFSRRGRCRCAAAEKAKNHKPRTARRNAKDAWLAP